MYIPGFTELATVLLGITTVPHSAPADQAALKPWSPFSAGPVSGLLSGFNPTQRWVDHFSEPTTNIGTWLQAYYEQTFPNSSVVTFDGDFRFLEFAADPKNELRIRPLEGVKPLLSYRFRYLQRRSSSQGKMLQQATFAAWEISWQGLEAKVFYATWPEGFSRAEQASIVSDHKDMAIELGRQVGIWSNSPGDAVQVYDNGYWEADEALFQAVQKASWDDVILSPERKAAIQKDYRSFFKAEKQYRDFGVPWKRGLILLGPPGNGKTVTIKAIMKEMTIPLLYVKSFRQYSGPEGGIRDVFQFARSQAPCLLVLEDLDSLIDDENRSFFLNEVAGLEDNAGLLLIGSTNHFDRLDPALSNRPSRFDRKYAFENPTEPERRQYAVFWQTKLASNDQVDFPDSLLDEVAAETEGFSFAYLQEAFVSALLSLAEADDPEHRPKFRPTLLHQIKQLATELKRGREKGVEDPMYVDKVASSPSGRAGRAISMDEADMMGMNLMGGMVIPEGLY